MRMVRLFSGLFFLGLLGLARAGDDPFGADSLSADQVTVTAPNAHGANGEEVSVPVTIAGAKDLGCLQMALLYDATLLEVKGVDKGPLLPEHALFEHDKTIPGRLGLGFLSGANANNTDLVHINGDGVVFNVRFQVLGRADQKSPLTPHRAQAWKVSNEKLVAHTQEGEFTITGARFPWYYVCFAILGLVLLLLVVLWFRRRRIAGTSRVIS